MKSFATAVLFCIFGAWSSSNDAAETPNVVLIISDDQAWTDYGFMGHEAIETPRLDQLAGESLVFKRGYVPSSLCRPSLATMVTGLYPHQHKITSNDPPLPRGPQFLKLRQQMIDNIDRVPTLPRMLAEKGYLSHQSGKWWEGHYSRGGFTHGMTHGDPKRGGRHGDEGLTIGRQGLQPIFDFIDEAGEKPFFIWYAPFLPHAPHTPPQRLFDKYKDKTDSPSVARYWAMCEWFDETCGQLLDYLDEKKLADNTIVLYVADNGWIQDPKGNGYAPRSKRSQYDGGLRTPIMIRWPGKVKPAIDDEHPVLSNDLAPTILTACGLQPTKEMPGVNLLDAVAVASRETIFGEVFLHNAKDIEQPASSLQYRWCINGWWKLIVPNATNVAGGKIELYNLKADPFEKSNLADKDSDVVAKLRASIEAWWPANELPISK